MLFSVKVIAKFPKKYTFYGLHHAYELAQAIVDDLVRANSLYFTKEKTENYQARRELFNELWQRWGSLINETKKLVTAIRDSDTNRLKV